jgi:hypothetical protein
MISLNLVSWRRLVPYSLGDLALCLLTCSSLACRRQHPLNPYIAYVVNHQSATLAAVNLADFHVTASLPVSPQPERVLVRPRAGNFTWYQPPARSALRLSPTSSLSPRWMWVRSARDLAFSPDGRTAYVLDPADHEVVFLDCRGAAGTPPKELSPKQSSASAWQARWPDLALSPDGKTLVAASENPNQITFISAETRQPLGTVEVGQSPGPMVILPDNSKVFVADTGEEKISARRRGLAEAALPHRDWSAAHCPAAEARWGRNFCLGRAGLHAGHY